MNSFLKALHLKKDDEPHHVQHTSHNLRPTDNYPVQQNTYQNTMPNNYQNPYNNYQNINPNIPQSNYPGTFQNNYPSNYSYGTPNTVQNTNYPGTYYNGAPNNMQMQTNTPSNYQTVSHNAAPHTSHNTAPTTGAHTTPNTAWNFQPAPTNDYDILERDRIVQHHLKTTKQKIGSWGPFPPKFPKANVPHGVDPVAWKRNRVIEVAQRYVGLPYQHHHIPEWVSPKNGQGVDCSNFSSWVYNFALGIHFNSDCNKQADSDQAPGRKLHASEPLEVGDLLFLLKGDKSCISHVVIYMGNGKIIDSGKGGVCVRNHAGWYKSHHLFTRRIIE